MVYTTVYIGIAVAFVFSPYIVWVQRTRLRASIQRVDPHATALRRRETVQRRVYSVDGPNSLWHIDGNHKLIRWKVVIHGGIDGHSRTIVFIQCATNNRADTVLRVFREAVEQFGLQRVRSDQGGENTDVWRFVFEAHQDPSAVIVGSSTHNERIERLWRDVFRCVSEHYYDLFYDLEAQNQLDPLNHTDLYCLHFVFLPRIQKHLRAFQESWNHHALSTENNKSPYQIQIPQTVLHLRPRYQQHSLCLYLHLFVLLSMLQSPEASLYRADHWCPRFHSTSILLRNEMTSAVGSI